MRPLLTRSLRNLWTLSVLVFTFVSNSASVSAQGIARPESSRSETLVADPVADETTLAFVRAQQPELANLLEFLKSKRVKDYRDALNEIRRVRERLENLKKRDQELYDVELALWQNSAQLRLWAASVSVSAKKLNDAERAKLTELVTQENELTLKRLNLDKARAQARLEQLQQQISRRQDQGESVIAKGIKGWESRIERPSGKNKIKPPISDAIKPTTPEKF
jgi:hypothetical protein